MPLYALRLRTGRKASWIHVGSNPIRGAKIGKGNLGVHRDRNKCYQGSAVAPDP